MKNIEEMIEIAEEKLRTLNEYKSFREYLEEQMKWNAMISHPSDEEHDETWYTVPEVNDTYYYQRYLFYNHVIETLDKEFLK
jgi:hypothetical protein